MSSFLAAWHVDGGRLSPSDAHGFRMRLRAFGRNVAEAVTENGLLAYESSGMPGSASAYITADAIAVRAARLDNRRDLLRLTGYPERDTASDLEVLVRFISCRGARAFRAVLGDYAVVIYRPADRAIVFARDPFGVKSLFVQHSGGCWAFASDIRCLLSSRYDPAFLANFLMGCSRATRRTPFADIRRVVPGTAFVARHAGLSRLPFWSAFDWMPQTTIPDSDACEEFGRLLKEAVCLRIDDTWPTWAQLSGGLDSSSIVMIASALGKAQDTARLAGTVTVVDRLGKLCKRVDEGLIFQDRSPSRT